MSSSALVTGASEGIGRALAHALARAGHAVIAVARNEVRLAALLAELPGPDHVHVVADLATREGCDQAIAALQRYKPRLLINNAGAGLVGGFDELAIADQLQLVRLNVDAVVALSHAFLQYAGHGHVLVNVSSVLALAPNPAQPVYSATKAFVTSFTEALWTASRTRGVRILCIHPGSTDTQFSLRAGRSPAFRRKRFLRQSADAVAREVMTAITRARGPNVVTGRINRIALRCLRGLPRRTALRIMSRSG